MTREVIMAYLTKCNKFCCHLEEIQAVSNFNPAVRRMLRVKSTLFVTNTSNKWLTIKVISIGYEKILEEF